MTRALGIVLASAATLGVIVAAFLIFLPGPRPRRPEPPPVPGRREPAPRVRVLAGETVERAVVLKPRYLDPERALFTDMALSKDLGGWGGAWHFVEVWCMVRSGPLGFSGGSAVVVRVKDGPAPALKPLRDLVPPGVTPSPQTMMMVAALTSEEPLSGRPGKGSFHRIVYAMPAPGSFADLVSVDLDGVRLEPLETTEAALEAFFERPRPDMIAALKKIDDAPASRTRAEAGTETPR